MRGVFPVRRQYSDSSASQRLTYRSASCWRTRAADLAISLGAHRSSSSVARWSLSAHLHAATRRPAPMTFLAKYPSSYTSSARRRARPQSSAASFFQAASRDGKRIVTLSLLSFLSFFYFFNGVPFSFVTQLTSTVCRENINCIATSSLANLHLFRSSCFELQI